MQRLIPIINWHKNNLEIKSLWGKSLPQLHKEVEYDGFHLVFSDTCIGFSVIIVHSTPCAIVKRLNTWQSLTEGTSHIFFCFLFFTWDSCLWFCIKECIWSRVDIFTHIHRCRNQMRVQMPKSLDFQNGAWSEMVYFLFHFNFGEKRQGQEN